MTEPVRTRSDVEREVREARAPSGYLMFSEPAATQVSAALLAMAECDTCGGFGSFAVGETDSPSERQCDHCQYTGLDQARVARGLNALEGR